jgi:hypothetical protein
MNLADSPRKRAGVGALVFVVVATVYLSCPVKGISDLIWSIPTVFSIMQEGDADLDEYQPTFKELNGHGIVQVDGHYRNYFPIGPTLVALVPIWTFNQLVNLVATPVAPFPKLAKGVGNWQRNFSRVGKIDLSFFMVTEMVLGSLLAALAAVFIQLMALELLPMRWALVVTGVFAFCTPVWSTASRDLGQHGPSVLMLSVALWLLVRARRIPWSAALAGPFVALSYVMRPTNSLSVILLTVLVAIRYRRALPGYCATALLVAIPFCAYNLSVYDSVFPPYYRAERIVPASADLFFEALAGNLISPARGLFVFSPVFLLSGYGFVLEWKAARERAMAVLLLSAMVLHWLVVSSFPHWWGGHSYGPRFMTDLVPYLCYFLVPVVGRIRGVMASAVVRREILPIAFCFGAAWSAFTHLRGATSQAVAEWNARPQELDVDRYPERLWDFRDPPFFRGL